MASNDTQRKPTAILGADVAGIPRGRIGTPEEVAGFVSFPACEEGAFVAGKAPRIDGGQIIGGWRGESGARLREPFPVCWR